ncbi:MAG: cyclic nucleotide-binding domain-containing protein [Verrucomicrobiota bacterium]
MNTNKSNPPDTVRSIIVAHPFFKNLNPHYLHLLMDCASFVQFGPGHDIFREGQQADHFYIINKGSVALETFVPRAGTTTVQIIHAGGALGWSWLYPPYTWQFSARAVDPVEAIAFGAASLLEKAEENHDFGYDLLMRVGSVMLDTLQNTRRKLVEFYVHDQIE